MSRIFRCDRCGTTFTTMPSYVMLRKGKASTSTQPGVKPAWIDLCADCTTDFLTWLHPVTNNVSERGVSSE